MRIDFGINNCFAVKRWPRPDEWADIVARELGLDLIQHSLDLSLLGGMSEQEADEIVRACSRAGLRIHSVFTGLSDYSTNMLLDPAEAARNRAEAYWGDAIGFGAALGASAVGGHVGSLSRHDHEDRFRSAALYDELAARLQRLAGIARQNGVGALLVENMACDREPCRMADVDALLAPGDETHAAIALCLDVGHQCAPSATGADADPYAWLTAMGPRTAVVHLQQSDATGDHHWPFTAACNARGRIDATRVLAALDASRAATATLVLEVIPPFEADDAHVLEELRESVDYWQGALSDHGHR